MILPEQVWKQIKNITCEEVMTALELDGWVRDEKRGAVQVYRHPDGRRVTIHYHPHKTFGAGLLKALIEDIGWTPKDMKRLKLVKK
jgi:predicted RNA binding protein YcfA (HicA-like mRNA interferase family)